jgi:hypothetical protein
MATNDKQTDIIFNLRHPVLKEKEINWKMILNSYKGGTEFASAGYLIKYPKESTASFGKRKERAVYFNQMSPVVDMLSGVLFLNKPVRTIPNDLIYLLNSVSGNDKKLNEFMRLLAAYSFMFTCGVLVDSPDFNTKEIITKKDRFDNKINPYAVMYLPFKIRDFNISTIDGGLDWVLLDDSYTEHSDPFVDAKDITKYTLWTRDSYQYFERDSKGSIVNASPVFPHPIGYVPFKFVAWRDDNDDFISESVCEDIAMVCKLIYNNMSYMDEMLASGTFKMLTYPSKDGNIPPAMESGGVGALSVIPYDISAPQPPGFIGAELSGIDPFIKAIEFYMAEILKKVGLATDETKEFVKSGAAKKIDFQKMRSLLEGGALMMGKIEEWIFRTAARWERKDSPNISIKSEYTSSFSDEDLQTEVTMLMQLLVQPIKTLKVNVLNLLVKKLLANDLTPDILKEIYDDIAKNTKIETTSKMTPFDTKGAAGTIKNQNIKAGEQKT